MPSSIDIPPTGRGIPVRISHIRKTYGSVVALGDVSLAVKPGEFVTLLGPSGSGKTTLLMIVAGFVRPDAGDLRFGERSVVRLAPHHRNIGMVFQNYALFPHLDVFENIAFPLRLRHVSQDEIVRRVGGALELVRLSGYERRRIGELSGGQGQRVALARAIVFGPDILLMDEPLSALDRKLREQMQGEIRRLHDELGLTTIYVTHDQREALTMSDRVAVINAGALEQFDRPRELYDRPRSTFVADFVGESSLLPVERSAGGVTLFGRPLLHASPVPDAPSLVVVLRPEKLRIVERADGDPDVNHLTGALVRTVFQGDTALHQIALDGGAPVSVRELARSDRLRPELQPGAPVTLALHRDDALVIPGTAT
jgi:putative spermidine/putrescine transport system ATP-binding protein